MFGAELATLLSTNGFGERRPRMVSCHKIAAIQHLTGPQTAVNESTS